MSSKYRIIRRWDKESRPEQLIIKKSSPPPEPPPTPEPDEYRLSREEIRALKKLAVSYEASLDYLMWRSRPWRHILQNLFMGMAKGLGIAIGISLLAFIAWKILSSLQILNLPIIGDFIAELLDYISRIRDFG